MKLRAKIVLLLVPLIVLPLLTLGWIAFERFTNIARTTMFEQMDTLLNQMTLHVHSDLETVRSNLELFSNSDLLQRYLFADEDDRYALWQRPLLTLFANYIKAYPDYYEIRVVSPDGYEETRSTLENIPNSQDREDKSPYFRAMRQSEQTAQIFLHQNPDNQETAFLAAKKLIIRDPAFETQETLRGYLFITIRPVFIAQQTQKNRIGKNGWIFLTNRQGTILFHPDAQQLQRSLPKPLFSQLLQNTHADTVFKAEYQGQIVFFQGKQLHDDLFLFAVLPEEEILAASRSLGLIVASVILVSILVTGGLFFVVLNALLIRPIRAMDKVAKNIAKGNFDVQLEVKTRDEMGSLASALNAMALDIKYSRDALQAINIASSRFVPLEFLHLLEKENIVDVSLGNHTQMSMTILFSDIRSFTSLSEKMSPKENFLFLNSYLESMGPVIREHKGFIDKYIGDAIMALFAGCADDAVEGAIGMLQKLAIYNQGRMKAGYVPIRIGVGLNTGDLMLGTIGETFRMEGTVISDAVNLAARVEGMTKVYGAQILISEQTYVKLARPLRYPIRLLDRVRVVGKSEPVTIFEVLDGDVDNTLLKLKLKTKDLFATGIAAYEQMEFTETIAIMEQVLLECPEDKAARIYMDRCEHFLKEGVGELWTGVTSMDSK
ncbi:MAG: HAMP domain-containing protein [Magnetococcales bacterium]|nr:HAMP domain-containing protein [Magnetococcales bacterium]